MPNYNLFTTAPSTGADADNQPVTLGTEFWVDRECWATQIRWFRPYGSDTAIRQGAIFEKPGVRVSDIVPLPMPAYSTWGAADIQPIRLVPGRRYVVAVFHPAGRYPATGGFFNASSIAAGPVTVPKTSADSPNGTYQYASALTYPTQTFNGAAYYSDLTITDENPNPPEPVDPPDGVEVKVRTEDGWETVRVQAKHYTDAGWADALLRHRGDQWN